jgi:hypothetical protein
MHWSTTFVAVTAFYTHVSAHGLVTEIQGANGVNMPGLTGMLLIPMTPKLHMKSFVN